MSDMHLVLHGLAIKRHAGAEAVAGLMGLAPDRAAALLEVAAAKGRAAKAQEKYMLTPTARVMLNGEYSRVYAGQRADPAFTAAYDRFEAVNIDLKQLITDWQTRMVGGQSIANDHSDPDYDAAIVDRLGDLHERAEGVLDALSAGLPRLSVYRDKLEAALEKAEDGDRRWISEVAIESYHTVWFELHEDLLRVLGREREE